MTKPFIDSIIGCSLLINECLTCLFYIFLGISLLNNFSISPRKAQLVSMYLLISSFTANALSSLINAFRSIKDFIKLRRLFKVANDEIIISTNVEKNHRNIYDFKLD